MGTLAGMEATRITELLTPYLPRGPLSDAQLKQVADVLALLLKWNARTNLTAVRQPEQIVERHFGESFFAAQHLLAGPVTSTIDLGSGAGFPGLPMAIYAPSVKFTLIESQSKKATFLKEAVRTTGLKNVTIYAGRAEDFPGKAELVMMRAVEKFAVSAAVATGLVAPGGRLALLISEAQMTAAEQLLPGLRWSVPIAIPKSNARVLLVGALPG